MPGQGRLGDKARISADAHGCPACPHPGVGPAIIGSPDVSVNRRPALRVDDAGIHAACCGPNRWQALQGASTVFINGRAAYRLHDPSRHCGGQGQLIEGSSNVIVEDASGGGGSGGGGARGPGGGAPGSSSSRGGAADGGGAGSSASAGAADGGGEARAARPSAPAAAPGAIAAPSGSDPATSPELPTDWIEIRLIGEDGGPIIGERFELTTPSGALHTGITDGDGKARVSAIERGSCTVTFPDLDGEAWEKA